jgi:hypothetical protein
MKTIDPIGADDRIFMLDVDPWRSYHKVGIPVMAAAAIVIDFADE